MEVNRILRDYFSAEDVAFSEVTDREVYDSQVTATFADNEKNIFTKYFGIGSILVGPVNSDREMAKKAFRLHSNSQETYLNLVYPKPGKNELRLYLSSRAGFKPAAGNFWFVYLKDAELWLGEMTREDFAKIGVEA